MAFLILIGLGIALRHHPFNRHLDQKSVNWTIFQARTKRLGVSAAFLFKTSLAAAVAMAFQEILLNSFYRRYAKIRSLDKVFTLLSNLFGFLSWDVLKIAPVAVFLAVVA